MAIKLHKRGGGSVSSAGAVGIGIGSAIIGIVLTIAAIFFFFRFRHRRPFHKAKAPRTLSTITRSTRGTSTTTRATPPANSLSVVPYRRNPIDDLPQSQGDNKYRQQLERLKTGVKNCVESFLSGSFKLNDVQKVELQRLTGSTTDSSAWIAALSDTSRHTRRCAIRALIARMLFNSIDPSTQTQTPLLPPALFAVYQSLMLKPGYSGHSRPQSLGIDSDREELIATWRQITGAYLPRDLLLQQVRPSVQEMALGLAPLHPDPDDAFQKVLLDLGKQAARLGLDLFTIPEQWSQIWTPEGHHESGDMVIFPGVELLAPGNKHSRRLTEPYHEHLY